jgi:hypothetical protein
MDSLIRAAARAARWRSWRKFVCHRGCPIDDRSIKSRPALDRRSNGIASITRPRISARRFGGGRNLRRLRNSHRTPRGGTAPSQIGIFGTARTGSYRQHSRRGCEQVAADAGGKRGSSDAAVNEKPACLG